MVNMILTAGEPWISLVGLYHCSPEQLDKNQGRLLSYYQEAGHHLPGFVGVAVHSMIERTGFFSISQWEDEETLGRVLQDSTAHACLRDVIAECHPTYIPCRTTIVQLPARRSRADILSASGLQVGDAQAKTNLAVLTHDAEDAAAVLETAAQIFQEAARPVPGFWGVALLSALNKGVTLCLSQWETLDAYETMVLSAAYTKTFTPLTKRARMDRYWFDQVQMVASSPRTTLH